MLELKSWGETLQAVDRFEGAVLWVGFGSKRQYRFPQLALAAVDKLADGFDGKFGRGGWLAVFGGDPYIPDAPDVAHLLRHLQEQRGVSVLALQCDQLAMHSDMVHYLPTILEADGQVVWGGVVDGQPVGATAAYLGEDFIGGENPRLKAVVAVGGGEIAGQEAVYAREHGVEVHYVRAEARFDGVGGRYGAIDGMLSGGR